MKKHEILKRLESAQSLNWFQKFEVIKGSGIYTPGKATRDYDSEFKKLQLDTSIFEGKRILEIGAATGALSFYLEDCGAIVVALDPDDPEQNGFNVVHAIRGSSVKHVRKSIYDVCPEQFRYFDIVFFYGVFYHLQHPLLAFQRINSVCKPGTYLIGGGSSCDRWLFKDDNNWDKGVDLEKISRYRIPNRNILNIDNLNDVALTGFSAKPYYHDPTIWYLPNRSCLEQWLETSGFKVDLMHTSLTPLSKFYDARYEKNASKSLTSLFPPKLRRLINRVWQIEKFRSSLSFRAHYDKEPEPEWPGPRMLQYQIPTRYELDCLQEEISQLKAQLEGRAHDHE